MAKFNVGDRVVVVRDADGDEELDTIGLLGRFGTIEAEAEGEFQYVVNFEDWDQGWSLPKMSRWGFDSTENLRRVRTVVQKVNKH